MRAVQLLIGVFILALALTPVAQAAQETTTVRRGGFKRIGNFFRRLLSSSPGCPEGQYNSTVTNNCTDCPEGSWAPDQSVGLASCVCDAGYYGTNGSSCAACPAGTYKNAIGNSNNCTSCPMGSQSPLQSTDIANCSCNAGYELAGPGTCRVCQPGYYKAESGNVACLPCPANTYSTQSASISCDFCPVNASSQPASVALGNCTCNPGYYGRTDAGGCLLCPLNTYNDQSGVTGIEGCSACPTDSESPVGSSGRGSCLCSIGFYGNLSMMDQNCSSCPNGTFNGLSGQLDSTSCIPCRSNSTSVPASISADNCTCNLGFYLDMDSCQMCEPGKYNDMSGQQSCKNCTVGGSQTGTLSAHGSTQLSDCFCDAGYYLDNNTSCQACEAGKYQPMLAQTEPSSCFQCVNDSSAPAASSSITACSCNAGFFGNPGGGGNCSACPIGTYNPVGGMLNLSGCLACQNASTTLAIASTSNADCKCNSGYYGMSECMGCPAGTYQELLGQQELSSCLSCPVRSSSDIGNGRLSLCFCVMGTYLDVNGTCQACPPATYNPLQNATGLASCQSCPQSATSAAQSAAITDCKCNPGFTGQNGSSCTACEPGKYKPTLADSNCTMCPFASVSISGSSSLSDCKCNPGYTGDHEAGCVACAPNTYKEANGSAPCDMCSNISNPPLEIYTSSPASVLKSDCKCNAGYTGDNGTACIACTAGTYKAVIGDSDCRLCPTFQASIVGAISSSQCDCIVGYFGTSGVSCAACSAGTYTSTIGSTTCTNCPTGSLSLVGSDDITDCVCDEGYFGANGSCTLCQIGTYKAGNGTGVCQNCTTCEAGFWSNCTRISDGGCSPCTNGPPNSYYNGSGRALTEWQVGVNCTDTLAVPPYPYPLVRTLSTICESSFQSDSCPFLCSDGFYKSGSFCVPCTTSLCSAGQYRSNCTDFADGPCVPCKNAIPANSYHITAGDPYNAENCGWACNAGYYNTGSGACAVCTNTIPANAVYSGNGSIVGPTGDNSCPWDCNISEGFYADGMECKTLDSTCPRGKCPLPELVTSADSARLDNQCYEWEYAVCFQNGTFICKPCEGVVQTFQGGWNYRTYTACPIGQYRAPCNSKCVFPDAGNMRGQCINCTNAASASNFQYTSSGGSAAQPFGSNTCEWSCNSPRTKGTDSFGNDICTV